MLQNNQNEILDMYDNTEHEGKEERGRRFIRWRFIRGLERDLTPNFMAKIREKVHTPFYAKHMFSYQLRNIEDGSLMVMYTNVGSPWFEPRENKGTERDTARPGFGICQVRKSYF